MKLHSVWRNASRLTLALAIPSGFLPIQSRCQAIDYRVLSRNQIAVEVGCASGCIAQITDAHIAGTAVQIITDGAPNPAWTLVTFPPAGFQFASGSTYLLTVTHSGADSKQDTVTVSTAPTLTLSPSAGSESINLESKIAFSLPGRQAPLANCAGPACPPGVTLHYVDVRLPYPNIQISFDRSALYEIDLGALPSLNPLRIGVIHGIITARKSDEVSGPPKPPAEIGAIVNVLGSKLTVPSAPTLSKPKVPATEQDAWLWINGTVTAGTGAAPAWVLDGKFEPLRTILVRNTKIVWLHADANVGNNKINGQTAKDAVHFSAANVTNYQRWGMVGPELSFAPTYETNLELSHKNFLAVGDGALLFSALNQTQLVRTAEAGRADPTHAPKQGDFAHGYKTLGWSLIPHAGFEAGGALASTPVTNPKTKALIGTIPTYSIGRFVPQADGFIQLWWFTLESDLTGRYLFTTEHTAVNNKAGIPYLKTVDGWKAVNVGKVTISPNAQNVSVTAQYTNGFSAPTYQRANGVQFGVAVKY